MFRKVLFPLIVALAVMMTISLPAKAAQTNDYAEEMLRLVNEARARAGVAPLRLSQELMEAAAIRAEEIVINFAHTRPNGQKFHSLIPNGYYTCGENIAQGYPTPEETFNQWMNSPGHRANILKADYDELGVGYSYGESNPTYHHYWVQIFRRPMPSTHR